LKEGIDKVNPSLTTIVIPNEDEALEYAYANTPSDSLVTIMCDVVARALDKIKELKEREEKEALFKPKAVEGWSTEIK